MKTPFPLVCSARVSGRMFNGALLSLATFLNISALPALAAGPTAQFSGMVATLGGGFSAPVGIAVDSSGNVYVTDIANRTVKQIPAGCTSSSCVTTLGGGFSYPSGLAVDGSGNIYIADLGAVKKMPAGCATANCVATLGGGFNQASGVAVDGSGNVYVTDSSLDAVLKMPASCASSSCVTTLTRAFSYPTGITADASGNVYVSDDHNNAVKKIPAGCASSGCITTLVESSAPQSVAVDGSGNVYVVGLQNESVKEIPAGCASESCVTSLGGGFHNPEGVAVDGSGNVYVADTENYAVKEVEQGNRTFGSETVGSQSAVRTVVFTFTSGGTIGAPLALMLGAPNLDFALAGKGSCTSGASFNAGDLCSVNVVFAPYYPGQRDGSVVLTDSSGAVIATAYVYGIGSAPQAVFNPAMVSTLSSGLSSPYGVAVGGSGNVYVAEDRSGGIREIPAGCVSLSCLTTRGDGFSSPHGVAVDGSGNVYIADYFHQSVKKMPPGCASISCVTTLLSGFNNPSGVTVDGNGNVYVVGLRNQTVMKIPAGCASTRCMATLGAGFELPSGVAVDVQGNVYVADYGNWAVSMIPPNCISARCMTKLGGGFNKPYGVAVDAMGNIYVADYANNAVTEMPAGCASARCVTKLQGGFSQPLAVALNGSGNLYVADSGNKAVKEIVRTTPPGLTFVSTPAGSTSADSPQTVTVENIGNIPLAFPIPILPGANNPSVPANFRYDNSSTCLQNGASAPAPFTLRGGGSCTVAIDFTPATAGSISGNVVLTDDNLNAVQPNYTTHNIPLSGAGITSAIALDFTIKPMDDENQTVIPGDTAGFNFQIGPTQGVYPSAVSLTATGLPQGATAYFSPSTIAAYDGTQEVILTIQIQSSSARNSGPFERGGAPLALGFLLFPWLGFRCVRKTTPGRSMMMVLLFATSLSGIALLTGCGGSNGFGQAAQSYTVTVTATSGGVQHSVDVNLNVQ